MIRRLWHWFQRLFMTAIALGMAYGCFVLAFFRFEPPENGNVVEGTLERTETEYLEVMQEWGVSRYEMALLLKLVERPSPLRVHAELSRYDDIKDGLEPGMEIRAVVDELGHVSALTAAGRELLPLGEGRPTRWMQILMGTASLIFLFGGFAFLTGLAPVERTSREQA